MKNWWTGVSNMAVAAFLARWMLGILFTVAGWWKVFTLVPQVHAQNFSLRDLRVTEYRSSCCGVLE